MLLISLGVKVRENVAARATIMTSNGIVKIIVGSGETGHTFSHLNNLITDNGISNEHNRWQTQPLYYALSSISLYIFSFFFLVSPQPCPHLPPYSTTLYGVKKHLKSSSSFTKVWLLRYNCFITYCKYFSRRYFALTNRNTWMLSSMFSNSSPVLGCSLFLRKLMIFFVAETYIDKANAFSCLINIIQRRSKVCYAAK